MDIKEYKILSPEIQKVVFNELLIKSIEVVKNSNKASVSHLQKKLKIGFFLASKIRNKLEELGIVEKATDNTSPTYNPLKIKQKIMMSDTQ